MAFNFSAPFGQSNQPAFGQLSQQPQQPNTANPFGAPGISGSPPAGKITFGARAVSQQQPAASNTSPAQPSTLFGSLAGDGQNSSSFGFGTGGLLGGAEGSQSAQNTALGPTPPFGGSAPGSGFSGAGFGTFGQGQQGGQGFGGFGAPAAAVSSSSAAPSPSNPFARLGARGTPAPAADKQSNANSFGTPPFGQLFQMDLAAAGNSATQPSMQDNGVFGNQQAGSAFNFGSGPALGSNPFAAPISGATVQPGDFGRAAKRNQLQHQQQTGADQQQVQTHKHPQSEQPPKRSKSPALLPKQLPNQRLQANASSQAPGPSSDLADPTALAARSQRFGPARPQTVGGSSWRASAAAGPIDADADTTDDQQGAVCHQQLVPCKCLQRPP